MSLFYCFMKGSIFPSDALESLQKLNYRAYKIDIVCVISAFSG